MGSAQCVVTIQRISMFIIRKESQDDRESSSECLSGMRTVSGRRAVLGGAAGGLTLAASGLLLPEWLVKDAQAENHPAHHVQHRADHHRQRQHHRLQQNRTQQRRRRRQHQDQANAPGVGTKILMLTLKNLADVSTKTSLWSGHGTWRVANDVENYPIVRGGTYGPYRTGDAYAGFLFPEFSRKPFVYMRIDVNSNPAPPQTAWVIDGEMTSTGYRGSYFLEWLTLGEGDSITKIMPVGSFGSLPTKSFKVTVGRDKDTRDEIVFIITIENAS